MQKNPAEWIYLFFPAGKNENVLVYISLKTPLNLFRLFQ